MNLSKKGLGLSQLSLTSNQLFFHQRQEQRSRSQLKPASQSECEPNLNKNRARLLSDSHNGPWGEMTAFQESLQHELNYQLIVIASR